VTSEKQKPVHSCGTTAKATGFDDSFIFCRGTQFVPLKVHYNPIGDEEALSKDEKSIKVYGLRRLDSLPLALGKVTVNNKNEM
jgi:hypothetical protein